MWRLAEAVPAGESVDLPNASADPAAFGMLLAILQRTGHDVTGQGQVDYYSFSPAGAPACYVILPASDDPARHGYPTARQLAEEGGLILYARLECAE
jgi:hypothetical protein